MWNWFVFVNYVIVRFGVYCEGYGKMDVVIWEISGGCLEFLFLCRKYYIVNEFFVGIS